MMDRIKLLHDMVQLLAFVDKVVKLQTP